MNFFKGIKILNKKKLFLLPQNVDVIIFDNHGSQFLKKCLINLRVVVLKNRIDEIDSIYLNFKILISILKNFFQEKIKIIYFSEIIKILNPRFIITFTDNSFEFFKIKKFLGTKYKFYAVQNADRIYNKELINKMQLDKYFTLSPHEKKILKRKKVKVGQIVPAGSLKCSLALKNFKSSNSKKKYDICLISEPRNVSSKHDIHVKEKTLLLAKFTLKFCQKYKLKLIISGESKKNSPLGKLERKFYEDLPSCFFSNLDQSRNSEYSSYFNIFRSKVTIGIKSTMLREALGSNNKVLICSFSKFKDDIIPIKSLINFDKADYKFFEKRLLKILKLSEKTYFKKFKKDIKKIISNCHDTKKILTQNILKP